MNKPQEQPRKVLGRGLSALLPAKPAGPPEPTPEQIHELRTDKIDPNPFQPRRIFQQDKLEELAQSIRTNGIVQPIVVRSFNSRYQIVAGERRWRAAALAGLEVVPVVVQNVTDDHLLEVTLIENIQREDLNAIETAAAFHRMAVELSLSHEEIGRRTGKDRSTVTNFLRLLQLPASVQQLIADRRLTQGHARCLVGLPEEIQVGVAEKVVAQGLSVRETERLTQKLTEPRKVKSPKDDAEVDPNVRAAIEAMERTLGTKVRIVNRSEKSGRIEIEFYSVEDLDRIYSIIVGDEASELA
jgi:ParB family chromosome partitioning protein